MRHVLCSRVMRPLVRAVLAGSLLAAAGAGVLALGQAQTARVATVEPAAAIRLIHDDLRVLFAQVDARATTLSQLPRLAAGVATDAATVRDLTSDELAFRVAPGEAIGLYQGTVPLLTLPEHTSLPLPVTLGQHVAILGTALAISEAVAVTDRGALVVTRAFAASEVLRDLPGQLVIGGERLGPAVVDALAVPLTDVHDAWLELPTRLEATAAAGVLRGIGVALILAGLALALWLRRPTTPVVVVQTPRFGRYEPIDLLGEGATGSVFTARARGVEGFERVVALKILRAEVAHDPDMVALFLDEARLAARVHHANVVQIFDLGKTEAGYFIAMEHIDGDDLERVLYYLRCEHAAVPLDIALAIAAQVCDGLHAAHTSTDGNGQLIELIHRDVKPGNVFVSRRGEVKIGDFGIAKATLQLHRTRVGHVAGTAQFMAPEQRMGKQLDARVDVFGAAALAWELVTGVEVDLDLNRALVKGIAGWPHLAPFADGLPGELEVVLRRALSFEASARPASCAELERELAAIAAAHGGLANGKRIGAWLTAEIARRSSYQSATATNPTASSPVTAPVAPSSDSNVRIA